MNNLLAEDHSLPWVIACDHAAVEAKRRVAERLRARGIEVVDLGVDGPESVDYPDYAGPAARGVAAGRYRAGVLLCGTGLGMTYAANRVRGIRAALCWSVQVAQLARQHNNANILVLPGRVATLDPLMDILDAFLDTPFSGEERHSRRVGKIESACSLDPDAVVDGTVAAVALDGPAGAGKSTVARGVAAALGWLYLDTGAMYRAVTLEAVRRGVDLDNGTAMGVVAEECRIEFDATGTHVGLNGSDVTAAIRTPEITAKVKYAAHADLVRQVLRKRQRDIAVARPVVMEGRDIATVVLPRARWKFFVTASVEERARRRGLELLAGGHAVDDEALRRDIAARDESDFKVGPLKEARDRALAGEGIEYIDTSGQSQEQVVARLLERINGGKA